MTNFGSSEIVIALLGVILLGFWTLVLWLTWTRVMSVRGIHHEIARLADQLERR